MARIHISADGTAIKMLRRQQRVVGLQVRVRNERVYVLKKADYVYTRSVAQDECRERFRRAQEMMLAEFEDPKRVKYWERQAKKKHFKTAKGCCKSYFYHKIEDMDIKARNRVRSEKSRAYHEALKRGEEGVTEYNELRSTAYTPETYGTESADVMKERRLATRGNRYERIKDEQARAHIKSEQYVYMVVRKRIDEVSDDEIKQAHNVYVRNGSMSMRVDKKDFVYYRKKGRLDKHLRKKRIEQAEDCGLPTARYYGLSNREKTYYDGKEILTSDITPKHKKRIEVTLTDLQTYDYKDELKWNDIFVTVAARKVFLDSALIEKLRDKEFIKNIKGIKQTELRRILRANSKGQ